MSNITKIISTLNNLFDPDEMERIILYTPSSGALPGVLIVFRHTYHVRPGYYNSVCDKLKVLLDAEQIGRFSTCESGQPMPPIDGIIYECRFTPPAEEVSILYRRVLNGPVPDAVIVVGVYHDPIKGNAKLCELAKSDKDSVYYFRKAKLLG